MSARSDISAQLYSALMNVWEAAYERQDPRNQGPDSLIRTTTDGVADSIVKLVESSDTADLRGRLRALRSGWIRKAVHAQIDTDQGRQDTPASVAFQQCIDDVTEILA